MAMLELETIRSLGSAPEAEPVSKDVVLGQRTCHKTLVPLAAMQTRDPSPESLSPVRVCSKPVRSRQASKVVSKERDVELASDTEYFGPIERFLLRRGEIQESCTVTSDVLRRQRQS